MNREDTYIQCPYYRRDGKQSVHCEGVEHGCGLRLGFGQKGNLYAYKDRFCRSQWQDCMVAKMLNRKYEYEP